jgi:hypothetical protein
VKVHCSTLSLNAINYTFFTINSEEPILYEQSNAGIEVRYLTEDLAKNLNGFDLRKTNLLVCKNLAVPENSFTTMMVVDEKLNEQGGYISYISDDIQTNEQRFTLIWENAIPFLGNLNRNSRLTHWLS